LGRRLSPLSPSCAALVAPTKKIPRTNLTESY
jgi:hypothetical protein